MHPLLWPELHGALTHFPIALLLSAAAFEVGAAVFRKSEWRLVSFWLLVGAAVTALPTLVSGWMVGRPFFTTSSAGPPPLLLRHRLAAFVTVGLAWVLLAWRVLRRDRLAGMARPGALGLSLVIAGAAGYTGFLGGQLLFGSAPPPPLSSEPTDPAPPTASPTPFSPTLIATGERLYQANHCDSCHVLGGRGGHLGPDLTREGLRHADPTWQTRHLKDPARFHPGSAMPGYPGLTPGQATALTAFLVTRR